MLFTCCGLDAWVGLGRFVPSAVVETWDLDTQHALLLCAAPVAACTPRTCCMGDALQQQRGLHCLPGCLLRPVRA